MNLRFVIKLFILPVLIFSGAFAAPDPKEAGKWENGEFVLTISPGWNQQERDEFSVLFDIDTLLMKAVFSSDFNFINTQTEWTARLNRQGNIELSKTIGHAADLRLERMILSDPLKAGQRISYSFPNVVYGANDLRNESLFSFDDGIACFVMEGHEDATEVFLAGSFNQWSTRGLPMKKTNKGWEACIKLAPGKYTYKFIVNGRWMQDPNNKLRETDGQRGYNSVAFCYNYIFKLHNYRDANRVIVAGSFNGFNPRELAMEKTTAGWELPIYLREGTHSYKFIVDGQWITDPANPVVRPDGRGNENSFMGIGDSLLFTLNGFTNARKVILTGSFNDWNNSELAMEKTATGWQLPYVLAPGNYQYKFIVDGRWIADPGNPYTTGGGDYLNSWFPYQPNYTFKLSGYNDARKVVIAGSFNRWNESDYRMVQNNGIWEFPIHLLPGRYGYKFIIDGEWIHDPGNELWETNEFGGKNSVLWIEY